MTSLKPAVVYEELLKMRDEVKPNYDAQVFLSADETGRWEIGFAHPEGATQWLAAHWIERRNTNAMLWETAEELVTQIANQEIARLREQR